MADPPVDRFPHHNTATPMGGVVLLVAISVLVGSLTVVYFLEFAQQSGGIAPITAADFDFDPNATGQDDFGQSRGSADGRLEIVISGGDTIPAQQLYVTGVSTFDGRRSWAESRVFDPGDRVEAGSTLEVWVSREDKVGLVWVAADGKRSALIESWNAPRS